MLGDNSLPWLKNLLRFHGNTDPKYVRSRLPNSWFTKRHTRGRMREMRFAYNDLTPAQQSVVRAKGWFK